MLGIKYNNNLKIPETASINQQCHTAVTNDEINDNRYNVTRVIHGNLFQ